MKNKKFVLIVLIPIFLHLMIFMIGPIIGGLAISFFDYNPLRSDNHFVGLDNFVRLVQDPAFWKATKKHIVLRCDYRCTEYRDILGNRTADQYV